MSFRPSLMLNDRPVRIVRDLGFVEELGQFAKVVLYRGEERTVVHLKGEPWRLLEVTQ